MGYLTVLLVNALILLQLWFFGGDIIDLLVLYCLETGLIMIFSVIKGVQLEGATGLGITLLHGILNLFFFWLSIYSVMLLTSIIPGAAADFANLPSLNELINDIPNVNWIMAGILLFLIVDAVQFKRSEAFRFYSVPDLIKLNSVRGGIVLITVSIAGSLYARNKFYEQEWLLYTFFGGIVLIDLLQVGIERKIAGKRKTAN